MSDAPPPNPLRELVLSQAGRFTTNGYNHFAQGFRRLLRYQRFLDFILDRHAPVAEALKADPLNKNFYLVGTPPPDMWDAIEAFEDLRTLAHLDIETYYVFAKILLDWMARAIEFYFGRARGCSLDSHDDLAKRFKVYAAAKGLSEPPAPLLKCVTDLKKVIADYRDYQIAHHKDFSTVQGTSVGPKGPVMNLAYTGGRKVDRKMPFLGITTVPLVDLAEQVREYLRHATAYLRANDEKAIFERRPPGTSESPTG